MKVFVYPITLDKHRDSFDVYQIGDLHWGAPTCDEESIHRVIDDVVANRKSGRTTRVMLMGDYGNCYSKLDRRQMTHAQTKPDALDIYTEIRDLLKPIAKDVVVCNTGNHDEDWMKSENIDWVNWLCAELKMPYGGYESYTRFKVKEEGNPRTRRNVDVITWHGAGGGRTAGGAFNKVRNPIDVFRTATIISMGHLHRLGMLHEQYMTIDEGSLDVVETDQYFVLTGGFLKGYAPESTYISRKMLPPVALGAVKLTIQTNRHGAGGKDRMDVRFTEVR